jgi:hypothetical protein
MVWTYLLVGCTVILSATLGYELFARIELRPIRFAKLDFRDEFISSLVDRLLQIFVPRRKGDELNEEEVRLMLTQLMASTYVPENAPYPEEQVRELAKEALTFDRDHRYPPTELLRRIKSLSEKVTVRDDALSFFTTIVAAAAALIAIASIFANWSGIVFTASRGINELLLILPAFAAAERKQEINELVPYFLSGILLLMAAAFIGAIFVALTTPTKKGTIGIRRTSENIIKMTGSFFVGFAMALLK